MADQSLTLVKAKHYVLKRPKFYSHPPQFLAAFDHLPQQREELGRLLLKSRGGLKSKRLKIFF